MSLIYGSNASNAASQHDWEVKLKALGAEGWEAVGQINLVDLDKTRFSGYDGSPTLLLKRRTT